MSARSLWRRLAATAKAPNRFRPKACSTPGKRRRSLRYNMIWRRRTLQRRRPEQHSRADHTGSDPALGPADQFESAAHGRRKRALSLRARSQQVAIERQGHLYRIDGSGRAHRLLFLRRSGGFVSVLRPERRRRNRSLAVAACFRRRPAASERRWLDSADQRRADHIQIRHALSSHPTYPSAPCRHRFRSPCRVFRPRGGRRQNRDRRPGLWIRQSHPNSARRLRNILFASLGNSGEYQTWRHGDVGRNRRAFRQHWAVDRTASAFRILSQRRRSRSSPSYGRGYRNLGDRRRHARAAATSE